MDFISNTEEQTKKMLADIGVNNVEELYSDIPQSLMRKAPSTDDGLSEFEGFCLLEKIGKDNHFADFSNYLGAGSFEHQVPAYAPAICQKSEFLTAYTPYQAEASQGMLQVIFEFQSAICALTGLDVSNASVYDGAAACAEACLMALRQQRRRNKILIAKTVNPHYQRVVRQYLESLGTELVEIPFKEDGTIDRSFIEAHLDEETAAVFLQAPSFLGTVEDIAPIFSSAKEKGVLSIVCADLMSYGLLPSAAEIGADIAVGDTQSFGIPLQGGGPYVGYVACTQALVRQMPGRIVGETVDTSGERGFVLTLQAREQHIRRGKATSNIYSNQSLAALSSLLTILWYGKKGVGELALSNFQRAAYLKKNLAKISGVKALGEATQFNEFVLCFSKPAAEVQAAFRMAKIEPGLHLGDYYPELENHFLIAVTETKSKAELDRYVEVAQKMLGEVA